MRYVHVSSVCLARPKILPGYLTTLAPGMHYGPNIKAEWNDGDRSANMTCVNCGCLMWGHYKIRTEL